jgi:hypothetical protein
MTWSYLIATWQWSNLALDTDIYSNIIFLDVIEIPTIPYISSIYIIFKKGDSL